MNFFIFYFYFWSKILYFSDSSHVDEKYDLKFIPQSRKNQEETMKNAMRKNS